MSTLSVIIITQNEEAHIGPCLQSLTWVDEIVVMDAQSSDKTVEIAKSYTDQVLIEPWHGYSANKQMALTHCSGEWILWIDADERVTPELAEEIRNKINKPSRYKGYEIARKAFFLGRWIKHCGWYPGYVLRLAQREMVQFSSHLVHEGMVVSGPIARLDNPLLHYTDTDLEHYLSKFNRYTSLAAEEALVRGRNIRLWQILPRQWAMFLKMYFFKRGFLDGMEGLILCLLSSGYVAMKYAKIWELQNRKPVAKLN